MYIQVKLLNGYKEPLLYEIPAHWQHDAAIGSLVRVPVKQKTHTALIVACYKTKPSWCQFTVRQAYEREPFPADTNYSYFLETIARYYCVDQFHFIQRIGHFLNQKEIQEDTVLLPEKITRPSNSVTLTDEQQRVVDFICPLITNGIYKTTLLHGVTGSGKTEVYKKLITHALSQNKTALLLLPEVTLALQFEALLKSQLDPSILVIGFHSASTRKEKRILWQSLLEKKPLLIIGVHLPLLLPIANLGLIIVDEEHDPGYQEKKHPKINTKEAALIRAQKYSIPILLGSATPSVSSLYNKEKKDWHFFQLQKRFSGNFPTIQTVVLTDKKQRRSFWISKELEQALKEQLQKKEQTIIFLNRRGFSFFVQCKECSFIFTCRSCSVSLTLHNERKLSCHYCGFTQLMPERCPSCKASEDEFLKKGIGTQQIVTILQKLLPDARIGRADLDTTRKKKEWLTTLHAFNEGSLDILVGTQTITKGYHFPRVTLVGIIWADLNLHFPMYNATEVALQQLIQVAGRAGRQSNESRVIVQAMAQHSVFNFIDELTYLHFYDQELATRKEIHYPPYIRFAEIELKHTNEKQLIQEAEDLAYSLQNKAAAHYIEVTLLGPAQPLIYKINHWYVRKIYIKAATIQPIIQLFSTIDKTVYASQIAMTQNPLH